MVYIMTATCIEFADEPEIITEIAHLFDEIIIDYADPLDPILRVFDIEVRVGEVIGILEDGGVFKIEALDYGG